MKKKKKKKEKKVKIMLEKGWQFVCRKIFERVRTAAIVRGYDDLLNLTKTFLANWSLDCIVRSINSGEILY